MDEIMKQYKCSMRATASKIDAIEKLLFENGDPVYSILGGDGERYTMTEGWFLSAQPEPGGYIVSMESGATDFIPGHLFEKWFTNINGEVNWTPLPRDDWYPYVPPVKQA